MISRTSGFGIINSLLAFAIILLPFNDLPYFRNIFGELAVEGAFYPLLIALIIWVAISMQRSKFKLPKNLSAKFLWFFLIWMFVSAAINMNWIIDLQTKGRSGVEKLLLQTILVVFVILSALLIRDIAVNTPEILHKLRRYIMISFLVTGIYSLIEIALLFGNDLAASILGSTNYLIHGEGDLYLGRLRSVSGEASWFAMYCAFIFPWVISYLFTGRKRFWVYLMPIGYLLLLVALTKSRTAYVVIALQIVLLLFGITFANRDISKKLRAFVLSITIALVLTTTGFAFAKTIFNSQTMLDTYTSLADIDNPSNNARYGSQTAAFGMAQDHPVFGVGLGQYGFYLPNYVPIWATTTNEMQTWMSPDEDSAWPPVHNLYARIAAELGFPGLGIWLVIWGSVLLACYRQYRSNTLTKGQQDILGLSLMVSLVGVLLSGMNTDSFRFFGYWIILGIAWAYLRLPVETQVPSARLS